MKAYSIGLYEKAMPNTLTWKEKLEAAKEAGYDFVEISIDETDERLSRIYAGDEEIYRIQDAAHKAGVFIQSLCLSVHRRFPFGSADPATRAKAAEIMEKALVFADKLGVRVIQLAGYDVYYEPSTDESKKRYEEAMFWAASQAARYQIMLGTEIMDIELMNCIRKKKPVRTVIL